MSQTENQRKGIFLYFNYAEYFDLLSMKERGELFTALMEGEEVPDMSKTAKIAFRFMHAQALRDAEKSMTNSINGRKGGRVKSSEGEPKAEEGETQASGSETHANGSEVEANPSEAQANGSESKPNKDKNENEDENEKDTFPSAYDAEAASLQEAAPPEQVGGASPPERVVGARKESLSQKSLEKEFNEIWELYPRKAGRKDALNAFVRARKKGVSYATIEDGVKEYARVCRTRDPQYIKYGSSWFTGEGWNDRELEVRGYDESAIPSEYAEACAGYTF